MDWKHTLSEPNLGQEEIDAAVACLESGWLSMGPRTADFERRFSEITGARHAIAVANGTAALHLALAALEVGNSPDDEVVQPAINFVAAANMTKAVGAKPVFADIVSLVEPTIDPDDIETRIGPQTKAIIVMHFGGYPARMDEIMDIAKARGLPVIEDACHGPGYRVLEFAGRALGTLGDIGCFSFFANKNITTGEGGMVTTDDDDLAAKVRTLRSHGMTTLTWERHRGRASSYDVVAHGFNYRTDDLRSALGLAQIEKLAGVNARRQASAARYARAIEALPDDRLRYVFGDRPSAGAAHIACVVAPAEVRDALRQGLANRGIQSSLHYPPVHCFSAFDDGAQPALPRTEAFAGRVITLPMHAGMSDKAPQEIVTALGACLADCEATV